MFEPGPELLGEDAHELESEASGFRAEDLACVSEASGFRAEDLAGAFVPRKADAVVRYLDEGPALRRYSRGREHARATRP